MRESRRGSRGGVAWWLWACSGGGVRRGGPGANGRRCRGTPHTEPACGREHARLPAPIRQSWGSVTGSPARIGPHYRLRNLCVGCRWEMTPSLLLPLHLLLHLPLFFFFFFFSPPLLLFSGSWGVLRMVSAHGLDPYGFIIPNTVLVLRFGSARFSVTGVCFLRFAFISVLGGRSGLFGGA